MQILLFSNNLTYKIPIVYCRTTCLDKGLVTYSLQAGPTQVTVQCAPATFHCHPGHSAMPNATFRGTRRLPPQPFLACTGCPVGTHGPCLACTGCPGYTRALHDMHWVSCGYTRALPGIHWVSCRVHTGPA